MTMDLAEIRNAIKDHAARAGWTPAQLAEDFHKWSGGASIFDTGSEALQEYAQVLAQRMTTVDARCDGRRDAGFLAFTVRDFMEAAGFRYDPTRNLVEQTVECRELIANTCSELAHETAERKETFASHRFEARRLNDLVTELRRQLEYALKDNERLGQLLNTERARSVELDEEARS